MTNNSEAQFRSLGDVWSGKSSDIPEDNTRDHRGIDFLIPEDVKDEAMLCGGREALDLALRGLRPIVNPERSVRCGGCKVVGCLLRIVR